MITMVTRSSLTDRQDNRAEDDAELFRALHPHLRRFAGVVRPTEVEPDDLVQEAVARTIRNGRLSDLENPRAYLSQMILNLATEHRRRLGRARKAIVLLQTAGPFDQSYPSDLDDLFRLPPLQRAVIYLHEVEGLTHAEIARQLGVSEHAAAKTAQRARKRLRDELTEEML